MKVLRIILLAASSFCHISLATDIPVLQATELQKDYTFGFELGCDSADRSGIIKDSNDRKVHYYLENGFNTRLTTGNSIHTSFQVLNTIAKHQPNILNVGIPQVIKYGRFSITKQRGSVKREINFSILITTPMGPHLGDLLRRRERRAFPFSFIRSGIKRMFDILEMVHLTGYIHDHICPETIFHGTEEENAAAEVVFGDKLYLDGFHLSEKIGEYRRKMRCDLDLEFCSALAMRSTQSDRRSDCISVLYTFVYLSTGKRFDWYNKHWDEVLELKESFDIDAYYGAVTVNDKEKLKQGFKKLNDMIRTSDRFPHYKSMGSCFD